MDHVYHGMLPRPAPGIDMRDPRVQAAVARLVAAGVPVNRVNIAEELAVGGPAVAPVQRVGAQVGERVAPAGTIEERLLAREKAELEARRAAELEAMRLRAIQARQGRIVR
jgi:hypothetical protein